MCKCYEHTLVCYFSLNCCLDFVWIFCCQKFWITQASNLEITKKSMATLDSKFTTIYSHSNGCYKVVHLHYYIVSGSQPLRLVLCNQETLTKENLFKSVAKVGSVNLPPRLILKYIKEIRTRGKYCSKQLFMAWLLFIA